MLVAVRHRLQRRRDRRFRKIREGRSAVLDADRKVHRSRILLAVPDAEIDHHAPVRAKSLIAELLKGPFPRQIRHAAGVIYIRHRKPVAAVRQREQHRAHEAAAAGGQLRDLIRVQQVPRVRVDQRHGEAVDTPLELRVRPDDVRGQRRRLIRRRAALHDISDVRLARVICDNVDGRFPGVLIRLGLFRLFLRFLGEHVCFCRFLLRGLPFCRFLREIRFFRFRDIVLTDAGLRVFAVFCLHDGSIVEFNSSRHQSDAHQNCQNKRQSPAPFFHTTPSLQHTAFPRTQAP